MHQNTEFLILAAAIVSLMVAGSVFTAVMVERRLRAQTQQMRADLQRLIKAMQERSAGESAVQPDAGRRVEIKSPARGEFAHRFYRGESVRS